MDSTTYAAPPVKALIEYAVALETACNLTGRAFKSWPSDANFYDFVQSYNALKSYAASDSEYALEDIIRKAPEVKELRDKLCGAIPVLLELLPAGKKRRAVAYWAHADEQFVSYLTSVEKLTMNKMLVQKHYEVFLTSLALWNTPAVETEAAGVLQVKDRLRERRDLVFVDDGPYTLALYRESVEALSGYADVIRKSGFYQTYNAKWLKDIWVIHEELFDQLQVAEMLATATH